MPKESVEIRRFEGMVGGADERDLPEGLAGYAKNLDFVLRPGLFRGLPDDVSDVAASGSHAVATGFHKFNVSGNEAAAFRKTSDNSIRYATGLDNAVGSIATVDTGITRTLLSAPDNIEDASSDGEAVHMGFGPGSGAGQKAAWLGLCSHELFNVADGGGVVDWADTGIVATDAALRTDFCAVRLGDPYGGSNGNAIYLPDDYAGANPRKYDNEQVIFEKGRRYAYYISAVYDHKQHAPPQYLMSLSLHDSNVDLQDTSGTVGDPDYIVGQIGSSGDQNYSDAEWLKASNPEGTATITEIPLEGIKKFRFRLWVRTLTDVTDPVISRRVTGFNIYRAEQVGGTTEGQPYWIKYVDINDSGWSKGTGNDQGEQVTSGDVSDGKYWFIVIHDDLLATSQSFEDKAGYHHRVSGENGVEKISMDLRYGLSTSVDGYHVVGRCYHPQLKEIRSWLFQSKAYLFDTFDWTRDYLPLPTAPVALATFQSRVYAFAPGRTYVVNPQIFDLQDTWEAVGCHDRRSVVVTDRGMFWCDANNIYHHDGSHLEAIGNPVLRNSFAAAAAWLNHDVSVPPVVCYHPVYESLLVFYEYSGTVYGLMYHVPSKRWQHLTIDSPAGSIASVNAVMYREDGTPLLQVTTTGPAGNYLIDLFAHASGLRAWQWLGYAKEDANPVTYYHAQVTFISKAPTNVYYYEDDAAYASPLVDGSPTTGTNSKRWKVNSASSAPWAQTRAFALRIDGNDGDEDVTHLSLIRRRIGRR